MSASSRGAICLDAVVRVCSSAQATALQRAAPLRSPTVACSTRPQVQSTEVQPLYKLAACKTLASIAVDNNVCDKPLAPVRFVANPQALSRRDPCAISTKTCVDIKMRRSSSDPSLINRHPDELPAASGDTYADPAYVELKCREAAKDAVAAWSLARRRGQSRGAL